MGLFDKILDTAKNFANENMDDIKKKGAEIVKDKAGNIIEEKGPELKDKALDTAREYLKVNRDKIDNEEGKKAVDQLTDLIDNIQGEHEEKELSEEEKEKLSALGDKLKEDYQKENK